MKSYNCFDIAPLVADGHHSVKIKLCSTNKEKKRYDIEFRDTDDVSIEIKLYSGYVPTFMQAIFRQSKGASGRDIDSILEYCKSNAIDIWTYYDDYGLKASYFPPKA